ncbi:SMC-Scp complex subunit ScpB [Lactobacillus amylolyticus]|uniref:SMC-Scp complex subunit ScpB n=1 Tax=Lactobacillus amylolyticus TaxID=83683 RepID=UPI0009BA90AB|nr:SMC-Scp complex subunit ScpB [Lactobacillus amylolyticus]ARD06798.1 SMC-Scp complex subunit ScpB [Lactobacillus amylolyticus]
MATKLGKLESLLYIAGDNGLSINNLCELLHVTETELNNLMVKLKRKYENDPDSGLQVIQINDLFKMTTSPDTGEIIEKYFSKDLTKTLSQSALEILSIVAYRQPITRVEIDDIRGVNSSGALQTLVWRGLIKANGKKDAPGHPNLYVTTDYFLQYFNFKSLADLPLIEDFEDENFENERLDFEQNDSDQKGEE